MPDGIGIMIFEGFLILYSVSLLNWTGTIDTANFAMVIIFLLFLSALLCCFTEELLFAQEIVHSKVW